jgi:hypothetical protein
MSSSSARGTDDAVYYATSNSLVRLSSDGTRTAFRVPVKPHLFAGTGFLWNGRQTPPNTVADGEILKLSYAGEVIARYAIDMVPIASDAAGNLWLRSITPEGDILGRLMPNGLLTRFGPIPSLGNSTCFPRMFGEMTFLSDGRVAMLDYYTNVANGTISPCFGVARPADSPNTITIVDPRLVPVLSIQSLDGPSRRRASRH